MSIPTRTKVIVATAIVIFVVVVTMLMNHSVNNESSIVRHETQHTLPASSPVLVRLANDPAAIKLGGVKFPVKLKTSPPISVGCFVTDTSICSQLQKLGRWEIIDDVEQALEVHFGDTSKERIFFDVGANLGLFGLVLASQGNWKGVSVEPVFTNLLEFNIHMNQFQDRMRFVRSAIGQKDEGSITININQKNPGGSFASENGEGLTAPLRTLDSILEEYEKNGWIPRGKPIDYFKLDIEGFEYFALSAADSLFKTKRVKLFQFEFGIKNMIRNNIQPADLLKKIDSFGYDIYEDLLKKKQVHPSMFETFTPVKAYPDLFAFPRS